MADETDETRRAPGWKRDPWQRFVGRYWDGEQWTEHVLSTESVRGLDPVPTTAPPPGRQSTPESPATEHQGPTLRGWWYERTRWQKIGIPTSALLVLIWLFGTFVPRQEDLEPVAFTTPVEGCHSFWIMINVSVREEPRPDDSVMSRRFLGYEKTYRTVDPVQASNFHDAREANSAAEVSDAIGVILRRCAIQGWPLPSQEEMAEFIAAAARP